MSQALAALAGALITVAACYAAGALLLDRLGIGLYRAERLPLAFLLGAPILHLAVFAIMALHIAYWPVMVILLLAPLGVSIWKGSWRLRGKEMEPVPKALKIFAGILLAPFAVLAFFHAWAPESSPDGYHLELVARYLRAHGFERITTSIFASLSQGVEMLFAPAFVIGRHSAAALVHFAFAIALVLAMLAYARRIGQPWAGVAAAFLTFASPVFGIDAASAYNDVAVAAVAFAVFYWLELWDESRPTRLLIPIGLLAGYSYALKYTAIVILPFAIAVVLWRSRKLKEAAIVLACSLLMIAPWMMKNWIVVQNPVAPFGNSVFRNPNVHVAFEQILAQRMRNYDLDNKWTLPLQVAIHGEKTTGVLGPVFLAAPLALLALREKAGRRLMAAAAVLLAGYFTNVGTRFLIPCLPFVSLAMALALSYSPPLLAIVMLFHAVTSWPPAVKVYAGPYVWSLDRILWKQALRIVPQDTYLRRATDAYSLARMVEVMVPRGERVFSKENLGLSYTTREVIVDPWSAYSETLSDIMNIGWIEDRQPTVLHTFRFPDLQTRRLRVVETAPGNTPQQQWGVHELRFYHRGVEVARRADWRLHAWPNPWDVQLAFDNSPATRWRTWEHAMPGMYLEVDFGNLQEIDEVRVDTSREDASIATAIEAMDENGRWTTVTTHRQQTDQPVSNGIRRAAMYELHARGINYILLADTGYGSDDVRDDPDSWGLKQITAAFGSRLYRVIW